MQDDIFLESVLTFSAVGRPAANQEMPSGPQHVQKGAGR